MPSYVSPNELLSITTFDEPKKDATIGIINLKTKTKYKDNEKEKASNEETGSKDNIHEAETGANNSKQSFKKRKYSSEKLFITDENDVKVKKKKKDAADQNIIDQQDEKEKILNTESEDKDNTCNNEINAADNNVRQSLKKRKHSSEKLFADESDVKVKKKKKDVHQSMTDQQNEKKKIPKEDSEDNEIDTVDNNDRQNIKKGKYIAEKSLVMDESDIKVKKKRKVADQNITYQQNEKEKMQKEEPEDENNIYDNEIDPAYDKQSLKKEKYVSEKSIADQNEVRIKKRRKESIDQTITDQQNEKENMPKEKLDDKSTYDNEIDIADDNDRQSLKKRKLAPEKSCIKSERDIKVTGNSNTENQEILNKNRNKNTEKKKRRHTIDNAIVADDVNEEAVQKECQKPTTNSNKNKTTEYPCEGDESNDTNLLQTEEQSTKDFGMRNSDIEETSADERKKKKNRKKRSKIQNNDITSKIGLQIMSKTDWKRLRNRYLDLQRHKMSQLKHHLRKAEVERDGIMTKNKWYHDKTGQNNTLHDKSKHENDHENKEEKSYGRVNYAPGIIVKIEMDEPCTDLQSFKVH